MTLKPCPQASSRRAAECDCAIVVRIIGPFLYNVLLEIGHVLDCSHVVVLIVGEDDHHVGSLVPIASTFALTATFATVTIISPQFRCGTTTHPSVWDNTYRFGESVRRDGKVRQEEEDEAE